MDNENVVDELEYKEKDNISSDSSDTETGDKSIKWQNIFIVLLEIVVIVPLLIGGFIFFKHIKNSSNKIISKSPTPTILPSLLKATLSPEATPTIDPSTQQICNNIPRDSSGPTPTLAPDSYYFADMFAGTNAAGRGTICAAPKNTANPIRWQTYTDQKGFSLEIPSNWQYQYDSTNSARVYYMPGVDYQNYNSPGVPPQISFAWKNEALSQESLGTNGSQEIKMIIKTANGLSALVISESGLGAGIFAKVFYPKGAVLISAPNIEEDAPFYVFQHMVDSVRPLSY